MGWKKSGPELFIIENGLKEEGPEPFIIENGLKAEDPELFIIENGLVWEGPELFIIENELKEEGPELFIIENELKEEGPELFIIENGLKEEGPEPSIPTQMIQIVCHTDVSFRMVCSRRARGLKKHIDQVSQFSVDPLKSVDFAFPEVKWSITYVGLWSLDFRQVFFFFFFSSQSHVRDVTLYLPLI